MILACLAWLGGCFLFDASELSTAAALATLACGLTYMQADFDRMLQVKRDLVIGPAILSAAYFLVNALTCAAVVFLKMPFWAAMLVLAGFGLTKAGVVMALTSRPNLVWGARFLWHDLRVRAKFSFTGSLAYAGYNHIPLVILAASAPPVQAAAFVAMRSLAQPLQTIIRALDIADKNTIREQAAGSTSGLRAVFWKTQAMYLGVVAVVLALIAVAAPYLVRLAYGHQYDGMESLAIWHCSIAALLAFMLPIESLVNILKIYRQHLVWRALSAAAGIGLSLALCKTWGAYGAATATAAGWIIAIFGGAFVIRHVVFSSADRPLISERRGAV